MSTRENIRLIARAPLSSLDIYILKLFLKKQIHEPCHEKTCHRDSKL